MKLPAHPKVPPPFPVQLVEGGPLQILGTNSTRTLNGTEAALALPPPGGYEPGEGPYFAPPPPLVYTNQANATAGQAPFPIPAFPPGEYPVGSPFPPFPSLNGTLPPFFASLPPGAAILPPPGNNTDYDEDDPSIYYPPPYSFYYPKDNTSLVQPGETFNSLKEPIKKRIFQVPWYQELFFLLRLTSLLLWITKPQWHQQRLGNQPEPGSPPPQDLLLRYTPQQLQIHQHPLRGRKQQRNQQKCILFTSPK